jgi:hypothetical protein
MIRTLIALGLLFGLAGAALAAPPAVSPPGKRLVVPPDESSPGPLAQAERPDGWTWFGMGFESRRARLAGDDEGSGPGEPWADGPYGTRANVAAGNAAGPSFGSSPTTGSKPAAPATGGSSVGAPPSSTGAPRSSVGSPGASIGAPMSSMGGRGQTGTRAR